MTDYSSAEFWKGAPEGATHYMPETESSHSVWVMVSGNTPLAWLASGDSRWEIDRSLEEDCEYLIPRPAPQWSGEGLPPVGVVCEAGIPHISGPNNETRGIIWIEGTVIAYHVINGKTYAWFAEGDGFYPPGVFEFRPIKTQAQIAAEEREAAAVELAGILSGHDQHITVRDIEMAKYLYDIGYRRTEKGDDK